MCNTTLCDCKGQKGRRGDVGPSGFPGVEGQPGDIGLDGPVGPRGDYGDTGEFGAQGEKGFRVSLKDICATFMLLFLLATIFYVDLKFLAFTLPYFINSTINLF